MNCIICGAAGTSRWTINNGKVAVVVDLCPQHWAPLQRIVAAADPLPPRRREDAAPSHVRKLARHPRKRPMIPIEAEAGWTPPS
jgi:hypothetical protein